MKNRLLLIFAFIVIGGAVIAQNNDDTNFMAIYEAAKTLNQERFQDINVIDVGDTIFFPSKTEPGGIEYWVADQPDSTGRHDCVWRLTQKYLAEELPTTPIPPEPVIPEPVIDPVIDDNERSSFWDWFWIILIAIVAAGLIRGGIHFLLNKDLRKKLFRNMFKRKDPDTWEPMIKGADDLNHNDLVDEIVQTQLFGLGDSIIKSEQGILVRDSGPKKIEVLMAFGDKRARQVYMFPGEKAVRLTIKDKDGKERLEYYRRHCGNLVGAISEDQFELPDGWRFVVEETLDNPMDPETIQVDAKEEKVETITDIDPAKVVDSAMNLTDVAKEAVRKKTPTTITIEKGTIKIEIKNDEE